MLVSCVCAHFCSRFPVGELQCVSDNHFSIIEMIFYSKANYSYKINYTLRLLQLNYSELYVHCSILEVCSLCKIKCVFSAELCFTMTVWEHAKVQICSGTDHLYVGSRLLQQLNSSSFREYTYESLVNSTDALIL